MRKRNSATRNLKVKTRKKRKPVGQRKKHVVAITPLEKIYFFCDHKKSVYRFFEEQEHADALARGDVYLSTLESCRAYEDAEKGDSEEAHETYFSGSLLGDGSNPQFVEQARRAGIGIGPNSRNTKIVNCSSTVSLSDAYVLCTTTEFSPQNLNEKFGRFCVEIKDPREFFVSISKRLNSISCPVLK